MPSLAQLSLMTYLLKFSNFKVINYKIKEDIGVFLKIEKTEKTAICPCCGRATDKLHQNSWSLVKDLPLGEQSVYLQVNRRVMRCDRCKNKFNEELGIVKKNQTHTI